MAKILVTFFSGLGRNHIPPYYDGFVKSLCKEGNDVLYLLTNDFINRPWDGNNKLDLWIDDRALKKAVDNFAPDVVFAFNNSCLPLEFLSNTKAICVMEADTYIYYNDKNNLKKYSDRFEHFVSSDSGLNDIPKVFGVKKKHVHKLNLATGLEAENIPKTNNISFIGSSFYTPSFNSRMLVDSEFEINKILTDFTEAGDHERLKDHLAWFSYHYRCKILDAVSDLDLALYGKYWELVDEDYPRLAANVKAENIVTLGQNQNVYNSSHLCLNISHFQAATAIPWRVMDVMASNGCLVAGHSKLLTEFLRGYINIPTFGSVTEAISLCKKLLADSSYREDIVLSCQQAIEDKGRWSDRLQEIEAQIGIRLTSNVKSTISARELKSEQFFNQRRRQYIDNFYNTVGVASRIFPKPFSKFVYWKLKKYGVNVPPRLVETIYSKGGWTRSRN
jgi:hypothetical protein